MFYINSDYYFTFTNHLELISFQQEKRKKMEKELLGREVLKSTNQKQYNQHKKGTIISRITRE